MQSMLGVGRNQQCLEGRVQSMLGVGGTNSAWTGRVQRACWEWGRTQQCPDPLCAEHAGSGLLHPSAGSPTPMPEMTRRQLSDLGRGGRSNISLLAFLFPRITVAVTLGPFGSWWRMRSAATRQ